MAVKINHDSFPENFLNVLKVDPKSKMSSTKQEGVHRHDATWKLPVVDHLASATERKVQDLTRPLVRARSETSQNRPPLVALGLATARGGLALSESPARATGASATNGTTRPERGARSSTAKVARGSTQITGGQVPQSCRSAGQLMNRSDEAAPRRGRAWT